MPNTLDICLGPVRNALGAPVLLTTTDADAAQRVVDAVNACPIYQGKNLVCFTRAVDRSGAPSPAVFVADDDADPTDGAPVADEGAEG